MKKRILSNKHKIKLALLSYIHSPKKVLKELKNKSDKELLFHLENLSLICNDNFNDIILKYDIEIN